MLSGRYWLYHPKPQQDESLYSWVLRTAQGNGLRSYSFCQLAFQRGRLLGQDIDRSVPEGMLAVMASKTATPYRRAFETTLASYEGWLVEKWQPLGRTKWVLHSGSRHRIRRVHGFQFCPLCLREDATPYLRRTWRLALWSCCPRHGCIMHDACPHCGAALMAHRAEAIERCGACDGTLTSALTLQADFGALVLQQRTSAILARGWAMLGDATFVRSHLYFDLLHQVMRLLASRRAAGGRLRSVIATTWGGPSEVSEESELERMGPIPRHAVAALTSRLLEGWPWRFVGACLEAGVTRSRVLMDLKEVPYELDRTLRQFMDRKSYEPSDGEVAAVVAYLRRNGIRPSTRSLHRYVWGGGVP
ncbi:TniQ family protein [Nitrospirillum pindoramense]|uniref:TniQ protein n=1 Tax=Nitrospirillum amazonense TaxID=28077 RepID=A0A560GT15_9PROT|nr:TniQ protein [Nitrospirillum amazonense]